MHILTLKLKSGKRFSNQIIYWYPIRVFGNYLISMNIGTIASFKMIKDEWINDRIIASYILNKYNLCFFYIGEQGNKKIFDVFKDKSLIVKNNSLNYIFSDIEISDILSKAMPPQLSTQFLDKPQREIFLYNLFVDIFGDMWIVEFSEIKINCVHCTKQISPHPIIHLLNFMSFSKDYYKKIIYFLLQNGFLVEWTNTTQVIKNPNDYILITCQKLSDNKILSRRDLDKTIETIVSEIFNKYEIFRIIRLATQSGNDDSILKRLIENLYDKLPTSEQKSIGYSCANFQPKLIITSVVIDFIITAESKYQLESVYNSLKGISTKVFYYDTLNHKTIVEKYEILKAMHNNSEGRNRFRCLIDFFPIDYQALPSKIYKISNAIKAVLINKKIYNNIKEMWIKKIKTQIFTPPQFEDDILYSIADNKEWFITRRTLNDYINEDDGSKTVFIDIVCDYQLFKGKEQSFAFEYEYSRDMQRVYSTLNYKISKEHNYNQFWTEYSIE
jgi:hypothetical protein